MQPDKEKIKECIEFLKKYIEPEISFTFFELENKYGKDWYKSPEWKSKGITFRNFLRIKGFGESAFRISDLEKVTKSGEPFYVLLIESALKR